MTRKKNKNQKQKQIVISLYQSLLFGLLLSFSNYFKTVLNCENTGGLCWFLTNSQRWLLVQL